MKSYLQQLENNEAILLMYLANELPAQDRAEVDEMLASDAKLRSELENLRQTYELAFDVLESLDGATRPPIPTIVAQNRVSEWVSQWVEARRQPRALLSTSRRPLPWWRTTFAAAAMLLIGSYIWAVYHPAPVVPQRDTGTALTDEEKLAVLYSSFEDSSENSNLHVAEVASEAEVATAIRGDADDSGDSNAASDSKSTGTP